jgi:5-methylcytosine-specific restriction protein A
VSYGWPAGSDRRWRRLRALTLQRSPCCEACRRRGRLAPATEVHHVRSIAAGGDKYDPLNLLSVCPACHRELHGQRSGAVDTDGMPTSPSHWWNA